MSFSGILKKIRTRLPNETQVVLRFSCCDVEEGGEMGASQLATAVVLFSV